MRHVPIHLPSTVLGSAFAEQITGRDEAAAFLADITSVEGYKERTAQLDLLANERFGVAGIMSDDAYITAAIGHTADMLTR